MLKQILANTAGIPLNVQTGVDGNECLITDGSRVLAAHWQAVEITTATTTTVIKVKPNESILLTDLIIVLSKKVIGATIIPCFTDGTNIINLFTFDAAINPFQFSHAFQGGMRGWKDAEFQIITSHNTTVSALVGYVHVAPKQTKSYSIWSAER